MAMDKGFTPLHYATKRGRTNLLCLLISKGAKVDTHARVGTPLQAAVVHGMRDVVESLLKNQANPNVIRAPSFSGSRKRSVICQVCSGAAGFRWFLCFTYLHRTNPAGEACKRCLGFAR
ncbi:hypothetical protein BVRB_009160 [Beta vulgaris subsp. vulgaris]|uniref:Uncharacterized protein n=1 Tax=Beta vulgaris subsp. vulgaris TaxID=3555 RepID=A0A0J8DWV7_BETVV|nr:hypothetical protein BVRB_009160 [Beta vulgaris subsp. vulgaris]